MKNEIKLKTITDDKTILGFLSDRMPDYKDRFYSDILQLSDIELERCHDQIQWIFPLHEESNHALVYPVMSSKIAEEAKLDLVILNNLHKAKNRIEGFLGIGVYAKYNGEEKHKKWCCDNNHNLLRITRIIRSLRLFGLEEEALDFYKKVMVVAEYYHITGFLNETTLEYWYRAMYNDAWSSLR